MKCHDCGSQVSEDAIYCGNCGAALWVQKGDVRVRAGAVASEEVRAPLDIAGLRTVDAEAETRSPSRVAEKLLKPGDVFAGRYTIAQLIGEGGMGVVYRADDKVTEKTVALKLIRADRLAGKDAVKRLIREGVTSRDIRHKNVVAVYDVNEQAGQPYMSMEFLGGQSMRGWNRQRMQANTDCSMKTAARVIAEILSGLEAAHAAGVVHRDLKPENVMMTAPPTDDSVQLKILDFGVARAAGAGDTGATSLGTRGYMAPEQITAPDAAQPSADLYSLSVMFYELLVGVVPQGHWQPPSVGRTDVPPAIDDLIQRGLSNNPRARPQSTTEYGRILAEAMVGGQGQAGATGSVFDQWLKKIEKGEFKPMLDDLKTNIEKNIEKNRIDLSGKHTGETPPQDDRNLWQWFNYTLTKRYVDGKGRAHRKEYWGFMLFATAFVFLGTVIDVATYGEYAVAAGNSPVASVIALVLLAPALGVTSRRLHDFGVSGWLAILGIIPIIGLAIGVPPGARGANTHGDDPLGQTGSGGAGTG